MEDKRKEERKNGGGQWRAFLKLPRETYHSPSSFFLSLSFLRSVSKCMCVRAFYWTRETRKLPELSTGQKTRPLPATISSTVETAAVFGVISTFREQTRALRDVRILNFFFKLFRRYTKSLIIRKRKQIGKLKSYYCPIIKYEIINQSDLAS